MEPQAETIVSLKKEMREIIGWAWAFWFMLAAFGGMFLAANVWPTVMLTDPTRLPVFNAQMPLLLLFMGGAVLFFVYMGLLNQKRMRQGFTHYQKTYFKDQD